MRTVVSVSMPPEMASRVKNSAAEKGKSFSAWVCELIEWGERFDPDKPRRANYGSIEHLFAPTEEDEDSAEQEVSEAKEPPTNEQADPGLRTPGEGRSAPPAEQKGTIAERVYACITSEKISVSDIANAISVSEEEVLKVLDRLIDQDGEPIQVKPVAGEWFCWLDQAAAA